MTPRIAPLELALDQPGSADATTVRRVAAFAAAIVTMAIVVVLLGAIQLEAFPQFATFHAGFIFLVDAITAFVLFGQFRYRRMPSYAMLAGAYLFSSLVAVPFLLAFPGALREGVLIGGRQSSIWIWHLSHTLFPALVLAALARQRRGDDGPLQESRLSRHIAITVASVVALTAAIAILTIVFHDGLPVLIDGARGPLSSAFYLIGGIAAAVTAAAMALAWRLGWQRRTILDLWLAVALTASLADVAASLGAYARYTVGWYFGRVEAMIAASVLLLVLLGEVNRLYGRLAAAMMDLSRANDSLEGLVAQKETLIAGLKRSEEEIRQLAFHDALTGLPNRRLLMDRIAQALAHARRHQHSMAIMFLDLDRFKQINDTLGHEAGDELLKQVAARLRRCVRSEDTACRSGGDEFIIVLPEITHPRDAALVAEKVIRAVSEPVIVGDHRLQVTTSIGIAVYPVAGPDDLQALMKKADTAMYSAKAAGRNMFRFYGDLAPGADAHSPAELQSPTQEPISLA
jgi:diguanylate cyclase (GGDEF)-like protein